MARRAPVGSAHGLLIRRPQVRTLLGPPSGTCPSQKLSGYHAQRLALGMTEAASLRLSARLAEIAARVAAGTLDAVAAGALCDDATLAEITRAT